MPTHQLDVPALPILLPLGGALMLVSWLLLRRRARPGARSGRLSARPGRLGARPGRLSARPGRLSAPPDRLGAEPGRLSVRRLVTAWLAGWYAVAVLGATLLPLHLAWGPGAGPPDLYRIIVVPLITMRVDDFLLNIVMTLPLAALLHLVAGVRDRGRVVLVGFLASLTIELTQAVVDLAWHGNRWADVNDLTANTLGAWLGFLIFWRLMRRPGFHQTVRRWAPAETSAAAPPAHHPVTTHPRDHP